MEKEILWDNGTLVISDVKWYNCLTQMIVI